jgi:hypothetical protein
MLCFHYDQGVLARQYVYSEEQLKRMAAEELRAWTLGERVEGLDQSEILELMAEEEERNEEVNEQLDEFLISDCDEPWTYDLECKARRKRLVEQNYGHQQATRFQRLASHTPEEEHKRRIDEVQIEIAQRITKEYNQNPNLYDPLESCGSSSHNDLNSDSIVPDSPSQRPHRSSQHQKQSLQSQREKSHTFDDLPPHPAGSRPYQQPPGIHKGSSPAKSTQKRTVAAMGSSSKALANNERPAKRTRGALLVENSNLPRNSSRQLTVERNIR